MNHSRHNSLLLKVGLLSASMLIGIQMSVSPAIPAMRQFYADLPREAVDSITTAQNFSGFAAILACPWAAAPRW